MYKKKKKRCIAIGPDVIFPQLFPCFNCIPSWNAALRSGKLRKVVCRDNLSKQQTFIRLHVIRIQT